MNTTVKVIAMIPFTKDMLTASIKYLSKFKVSDLDDSDAYDIYQTLKLMKEAVKGIEEKLNDHKEVKDRISNIRDLITEELFGQTMKQALESHTCLRCKLPVKELSTHEWHDIYHETGICETCNTLIFNEQIH
jgi:hypothetical protein